MALDKKLKAKLGKASSLWNKAKTRAAEGGTGFDEFEDGRYVCRLVSAEIGESKSSGRVQVAWGYKFAEGEYKGKTKFDYEGLETEENLMYLARKFAKYGYEAPDTLDEIEGLLKAIVNDKPLVRIRLKTKGEFQNAYLDSVFSPEDEEEALAEAAAAASETEGEEEAEGEEAEEGLETEEAEEPADDEAADDTEDDEAEEEEAADDDDVELAVGVRVMAPYNGDMAPGEVIEILEKEEKVRVKLDLGKTVRVKIDTLAAAEDTDEADDDAEEDEEEEVPAAPQKKAAPAKAAPAPAKKAAAPAKKDDKKKKK